MASCLRSDNGPFIAREYRFYRQTRIFHIEQAASALSLEVFRPRAPLGVLCVRIETKRLTERIYAHKSHRLADFLPILKKHVDKTISVFLCFICPALSVTLLIKLLRMPFTSQTLVFQLTHGVSMRRVFAFLLTIIGLCSTVLAQNTSFTGHGGAPSGAAVAGAGIEALNQKSGQSATTTTTGTSDFTAPYLKLGLYAVRIFAL